MNDNKEIESIQDYLDSKEKERETRMSRIHNDLKFEDELISNYNNHEDEIIKPVSEPTYEKYIKGEEKERKKHRFKISNILLYMCFILLPIVISLSFISMHTLYLVRKPFNYICMGMSVLCIIGIIILFIYKIVKRDKSKKIFKLLLSNSIMITLLTILDAAALFVLVRQKAWMLMDKLITHYKLILLIIGIVLLIIIILIIITKIRKRKFKKSIKRFFINMIVCIYILGILDGMLMIYRSSNFKEWLITTAMQTMNHQYYCKWFYSAKDIKKIMDNNYVLESGESTDSTLIDLEKEEEVSYANEYERAVLEREKNAAYKIVNLEVNGCKGYLGVVYDPKTVHVLVTNRIGVSGQYVTTMAKNNNAVLAINGGGFYDPEFSSTGGSPTGITISDGKVITKGEYGMNTQSGGIIGFDDNGVLYLLKDLNVQNALNKGIKNAVTMGPFLIVNGKRSFIKGNGGWGYAARTAIGQRKDGIVLFLVIDSNATRTKGADMVDLTDIMENYGAINAANLDGGTSSVMVENGELINDPIDGYLRHQTRPIADAFGVIVK